MDKTVYCNADVTIEGDLKMDWSFLRMLLLRFAGKKVIVRIQTWTKRRSLAANNYYFGVLVKELSDYTGYTKEETHRLLKSMFAIETMFVVNEKTGEVTETEVPLKTRTMSQARFAKYIDDCTDFASGLGIVLPTYSGDKYAYAEDENED
jgi:hypothetical protein